MELDNSFDNFVLASQGEFRAGQLTGCGHRVRSKHTSAGFPVMKRRRAEENKKINEEGL
jgi:hypothetical protein